MPPDLSIADAYSPFSLLDRPMPIVQRQSALVSRSGVCMTLGGLEEASIHPGFPGLARELTWVSMGQVAKRGVQFSGASEPHLLFHCPWSTGYYHWLIEAIPRLLSLRDHWGEYRLIIPDAVPNPWFANWLKEISGGNYTILRRGGLLVRNVVFQQCGQRIDRFSPHAVQLLVEYFQSRFETADRPIGPRRLYVSRERARHRKVANEPDVIDRLAARGFAAVFLEEMSFPEQVRAFAAADAVVSIHGAGLANAVFMRPGSCLLELIQRPDPTLTRWRRTETHLLNPCFRGLASVRGVHHDALLCAPHIESTPDEVLKRLGPLHANLQVDVGALCLKLDDLLVG